MAEHRLTVQITPADAEVRLEDMARELHAINAALFATEESVFGRGRRVTDYQVVDLHHSAPTVAVDAIQLDGSVDRREEVFRAFFDGVEFIRRTRRLPPAFGYDVLISLRELVAPIGYGVRETLIKWADQSAVIGIEFKKKIGDLSAEDEQEDGEVDGLIEQVNVHADKRRFRLFPLIGPEFVTCHFKEDLFEQVRNCFGRYVVVHGKLRYRKKAQHPYRIDVAEMTLMPSEVEQPTLLAIKGIVPRRGPPDI